MSLRGDLKETRELSHKGVWRRSSRHRGRANHTARAYPDICRREAARVPGA